MTAAEAPIGEWIMVNRTKIWYKKEANGKSEVICSRIGTRERFKVANDEPIMVRK